MPITPAIMDDGEGCVFSHFLSLCICGGMVAFSTHGSPTVIYNLLFKEHLLPSFGDLSQKISNKLKGTCMCAYTTVTFLYMALDSHLSEEGESRCSYSVSFGDSTLIPCAIDSWIYGSE